VLHVYSLNLQAGDSPAVAKVAVQVIRRCWQARDYSQLNANLMVIAKRRAQLKQAIAEMVQEAMTYVGQIASLDDRLQLVSTLRTVTDGKVSDRTPEAGRDH
jgi:26S proteasome regulatory subunit N5